MYCTTYMFANIKVNFRWNFSKIFAAMYYILKTQKLLLALEIHTFQSICEFLLVFFLHRLTHLWKIKIADRKKNIRGRAENEGKNETRNDFSDSRTIYFSTQSTFNSIHLSPLGQDFQFRSQVLFQGENRKYIQNATSKRLKIAVYFFRKSCRENCFDICGTPYFSHQAHNLTPNRKKQF